MAEHGGFAEWLDESEVCELTEDTRFLETSEANRMMRMGLKKLEQMQQTALRRVQDWQSREQQFTMWLALALMDADPHVELC